jgi:hypothetical protein
MVKRVLLIPPVAAMIGIIGVAEAQPSTWGSIKSQYGK